MRSILLIASRSIQVILSLFPPSPHPSSFSSSCLFNFYPPTTSSFSSSISLCPPGFSRFRSRSGEFPHNVGQIDAAWSARQLPTTSDKVPIRLVAQVGQRVSAHGGEREGEERSRPDGLVGVELCDQHPQQPSSHTQYVYDHKHSRKRTRVLWRGCSCSISQRAAAPFTNEAH